MGLRCVRWSRVKIGILEAGEVISVVGVELTTGEVRCNGCDLCSLMY